MVIAPEQKFVNQAVCEQCEWRMVLLDTDAIQHQAENHMMETGHTVKIKEVK